MCGIVAFIGEKKSASRVIFDGLKLLEYRGYDSSGIALIHDNEIKTFKKKGRVKESENLYNKNQIKENNYGKFYGKRWFQMVRWRCRGPSGP